LLLLETDLKKNDENEAHTRPNLRPDDSGL
jgi:hypothetical protein